MKKRHSRSYTVSLTPHNVFLTGTNICEHIIRHYTQGWADGFYYKASYWEIWNEADGVNGNGDQPNWSGTAEQYYELYDITARHLKNCFPDIKVGGPTLADVCGDRWITGFFEYITKNGRAPLDFLSWHIYNGAGRLCLSQCENASIS